MNDRLGIDFENFENSSWPRLAMASPVIAVMLIGTFCNVSLRFWAVTTISPPPLSAVAWSACCAAAAAASPKTEDANRSEEHTSELQSLMRISYAVFCLKKKNDNTQ